LIEASAAVGPRYLANPLESLTLPAIYRKRLDRLFPDNSTDPRRRAIASTFQYAATVILTELAEGADPRELDNFLDSLCDAQEYAMTALESCNRGRAEG